MTTIFGEETFPHFTELPQEIQMQIWRYAATPFQVLRLNDLLFAELTWRLPHPPSLEHFFIYWTRILFQDLIYYRCFAMCYTVTRRLILSSTCRCARLMALEAWKKDLEVIQVNKTISYDEGIALYCDDLVELKFEVQAKLFDNLNELIRRTKNGGKMRRRLEEDNLPKSLEESPKESAESDRLSEIIS